MQVRPTSETIVNHMFTQWIHSYRDLPLMVNQVRLFLTITAHFNFRQNFGLNFGLISFLINPVGKCDKMGDADKTFCEDT